MLDMRDAIVQWFETDFKSSAQATTKTSRLPDGRLSYSFSVTNNSGFDFDRFSFRIKVINKADGSEIGSASIKAGEWASGETKNFKSRLAIPEDVRSISFVMYANSIDFEARPSDSVSAAFKDMGDMVREVGDAIAGADGSGGVLGELFGTGGMPQTTTTKTTTTRSANGTTTTKTTTTTTTRRSNSGTVRDARQTVRQGQCRIQQQRERQLHSKEEREKTQQEEAR